MFCSGINSDLVLRVTLGLEQNPKSVFLLNIETYLLTRILSLFCKMLKMKFKTFQILIKAINQTFQIVIKAINQMVVHLYEMLKSAIGPQFHYSFLSFQYANELP